MSIEAMKQALEAWQTHVYGSDIHHKAMLVAMTNMGQAIAEAEKDVSYLGNGTAGRENMTAPTGFFFQMPKLKEKNT